MLDGKGLYFDGQLPFLDRTDIASADSDLAEAMTTIRAAIDAEFGPQQWQNISESRYKDGNYGTCGFEPHEGRYTARDEGLTFGIADDDMPRILTIVQDTVAALGYTTTVDSSDENWIYIDIYNEDDGGFIHLTKARGKGLIFQTNTGCRPWSDD